MNGLGTSPESVREAIRLAAGEPELVIVDARVLRLLMGPLSELIILKRFATSGQFGRFENVGAEDERFVWDDQELCP